SVVDPFPVFAGKFNARPRSGAIPPDRIKCMVNWTSGFPLPDFRVSIGKGKAASIVMIAAWTVAPVLLPSAGAGVKHEYRVIETIPLFINNRPHHGWSRGLHL